MMGPNVRIQNALRTSLDHRLGSGCPPRLAEALQHAVFPGGHRIRPRLCLAVAFAFGDDRPEVTDAAAASIELLHCASLVHDDMPCFDDAPIRRGKPSVHVAFGEPLALLAGDALIVLAFQTLAAVAHLSPARTGTLMGVIGDGVGVSTGIVAGQAWECEPAVPLGEYQRAKTGALFAAATMAGAAAAGAEPAEWGTLGERIGEAYQVADDLLDRYGDADVIGKPVGRDIDLERPNAIAALGVEGATKRLRRKIEEAVDAVPVCPGKDALRDLIADEARRFMQLALDRRAAA